MNNVEPRKNENDALMDWAEAPLFNQNVVPQINNTVPQISNLTSSERFNVEPQMIPNTPEINLPVVNADLLANENVELHQKENVELHQKENIKLLNSEKPIHQKKSRKKQSDKKICSQKRSVVPIKLFVLSAEKIDLENRAKESGCSLSNFIRLNLGLAPNETGRKKQNIQPAFDLGDLDLED